ncbi:class I histocompatibility antigen, F10 alpha chain-like isoform X2 [Rhea pennata]|uniref:class I histocompatibility antigen, F10 alpha chain-like isoform X2 n=1 Tax=Rhea pennata TaxID=8795 RepID=UPI002E25571B
MGPAMGPGRRLLLLLALLLGGCGAAVASGPHSLRYFYTAVTEPSAGLPVFVIVGYVDGETFMRYDSETRKGEPRAAWMRQESQQYWDEETQIAQQNQQVYRMDLDTLQKRYNQSGGYHTIQAMYGCDILEGRGTRGFWQDAYDGRDFIALNEDLQTYTAMDAGAEITKRKWEADEALIDARKQYLKNTCVEWLRKYVEYGKATLERRERPAVRVSRKENQDFLTLSCRAHGFYPRPITISWLKKGRVQDQETRWGGIVPNGDGTYHASAAIDVRPAEEDEYRCRVEHASMPEPGIFSWEPESNLVLIIVGVVAGVLISIIAALAGFVIWKKSGRQEKGYAVTAGCDGEFGNPEKGSNCAI